MKRWSMGLAIFASACVINGKSYGPGSGNAGGTTGGAGTGGSSTSGGGGGGSAPPAGAAGTGTDTGFGDIGDRADAAAGDRYWGARRYGSGPADPWIAVAGDQPKLIAHARADYWKLRGDDYDCNAAHDHCLEPLAWFTVRESDLQRGLPRTVGMNVFGAENERLGHLYMPVNGHGSSFGGEPFVAYRTVPATRTNIGVGSLVIALDRNGGRLRSAEQAFGATWWLGEVEEIDLDGGFFKLKDRDDVFKLWGARPVVLLWKPGSKVQVIGKQARDKLAVKASDTFAPE